MDGLDEDPESPEPDPEGHQVQPLPSCPNCGYQALSTRDDLIVKHDGMGECPKCGVIPGKFTKSTVPRSEPSPPVDLKALVDYIPLRTRTRWLVFLLAVNSLANVAMIVSTILQLRFLVEIGEGTAVTEKMVLSNDLRQTVVYLILSASGIPTFILFLVWIYRGHKNLPSLSSTGLKYSPAWAVGGYFVPLLNLIRPYQVMKEICIQSDPESLREGSLFFQHPGGLWLARAWWGSALVTMALLFAPSNPRLVQVSTPNHFVILSALLIAALFFNQVNIYATLRLILKIASMQEEKEQLLRGGIEPEWCDDPVYRPGRIPAWFQVVGCTLLFLCLMFPVFLVSLALGPAERRFPVERKTAVQRMPINYRTFSDEDLIEKLTDLDPEVRERARVTLRRRGEKAGPALIKGLEHWDPRVRASIAEFIRDTCGRMALDPLIRAMKDPIPNVRIAAVKACGDWRDEKLFKPLADATRDDHKAVRAAALLGFCRFDGSRVRKELLRRNVSDEFLIHEMLRSGIYRAVGIAASLLGEQKKSVHMDHLLFALNQSKSEYNVLKIVEALAEIGDPRAVHGVAEKLDFPSHSVRSAAAKALGRLGMAGAGYLVDALSKGGLVFKSDVYKAIKAIGPDAAEELVRALGYDHADARVLAASLLGRFKDSVAVPGLIGVLSDVSKKVRETAVFSLGEIGDPRGTLPLAALIGVPEQAIRHKSIEALGKIGDRRAVEPLIDFFGKTDPITQGRIATALGKIGDAIAMETLLDSLNSENAYLKRMSIIALGDIGSVDSVPQLIGCLKTATLPLDWDVARALTKITGMDYGRSYDHWKDWLDRKGKR